MSVLPKVLDILKNTKFFGVVLKLKGVTVRTLIGLPTCRSAYSYPINCNWLHRPKLLYNIAASIF